MKYKTTIGSLPYIDAGKACEMVFEYTPELPAWPQLPNRSFRENMLAQYSENFPGIFVDDSKELVLLRRDKFEEELERYFSKYESRDTGYFAISEKNAAGFYEFLSYISKNNVKTVKCQTTGPITFGMSVKESRGDRSIYYDSTMRQIVEVNCIMKSVWQIENLKRNGARQIVLSLDEPYLAAYGSAFTAISKEDVVNSLKEVYAGVKVYYPDVKIGVHCCANTDWSVLCEANVDIISFDAYGFSDSLLLYADSFRKFIDKGGILAWGIVPTNEEALNAESALSLEKRLKDAIGRLSAKGIDKNKLTDQLFVTPACGFGSQPEAATEKALKYLSELKFPSTLSSPLGGKD